MDALGWFDLGKYAKTKTMTLADWYAEIKPRAFLRNIFVPQTEWDDEDGWQRFHQYATPFLEDIKKFGLLQNFPSQFPDLSDMEIRSAILRELHPGYSENTIGVLSLSVEEAYRLVLGDDQYVETMKMIELMDDDAGRVADHEKWVRDQLDEKSMKFRCETSARLSVPMLENPKWHDDDIKFVKVNLDCSDVQLKREFGAWLKAQREKSGTKNVASFFNSSDLADWHDNAILPYFDIVAVQKIEGKKKPTNNAIARKIFPNEFEVDIVERTRKVTEKKFKHLFTQEVVSQLELQARSTVLKPE